MYGLSIAVLIIDFVSLGGDIINVTIFGPLVVYFLLCLSLATIEGTWKEVKKMTHELRFFQLKIKTPANVERVVTAEDVVLFITSKERALRDKWWAPILVWVLPALCAGFHVLVPILFLIHEGQLTWSSDWLLHTTVLTAFVLNFLFAFVYLMCLGFGVTVYHRQLQFVRFFSAVSLVMMVMTVMALMMMVMMVMTVVMMVVMMRMTTVVMMVMMTVVMMVIIAVMVTVVMMVLIAMMMVMVRCLCTSTKLDLV